MHKTKIAVVESMSNSGFPDDHTGSRAPCLALPTLNTPQVMSL